MNRKEVNEDIYDDFKLKKTFYLQGFFKKNSVIFKVKGLIDFVTV